jgi:hypothetical protein
LVLVGLIFLFGVDPLMMFLWSSGWRWQPNQPEYEQMILGVYATLGIFLLLAARNPAANRSLIAFCGVVELCPRRANVVPSIAQHDRSQRTDRVGCVRGDRHSAGRSGSGKEVSGASL